MDDSTQHIATLHEPIVGHHRQGNRTLLRESLMAAPGVVKGDVRRENPVDTVLKVKRQGANSGRKAART